jgi:hypothetical protein
MYYAHTPEGDWKDYHVGDRIDFEVEERRIPEIEYIQADGHELNAIVKVFQGTIPLPVGPRVIRWYGDLARTIHYAMLTSRGFGVFDERS